MLHPFMGIENWDRIGMSVEESAKTIQRIAYVDRQLMRIEAGHMAARPEYEIKGALARLSWQDAEHHEQFRQRGKQLRMSTVAFDKCPDPALQELMQTVLDSNTTLELLTALFEVIKPAQMAALHAYKGKAQPLVDEPTFQIIKHQLIDREEQMAWGREALAHVAETASEAEKEQAQRWRTYIQQLLAAAGSITGWEERVPVDATARISREPFTMPRASTRDSRFTTHVVKNHGITFADNDEGRFMQMMMARYFEMSPAEGVAYVHFTTEGKPWSFYRDTARHMWDEVRHSWFGEAALRKKGYDVYQFKNWTGWYDMTAQLFEGTEAYSHLTIAIEKAAMKYPPGKREEWEFCRDVVKDPLMTTFQDFDWADEVVHAGFGQRWMIEDVHGGDARAAQAEAESTVRKRTVWMEAQGDHNKNKPAGSLGGY
ncbi:hypothetical protein [Paenibacillus roseipurpureus]|uniref:Uncharacterized protein n=1 Tax=Paenibacillus roseopurpureus TaxID=2918901 RepID=A0AA96RJJ8_9BACL|nr:hypothetical protein [Paenibacillus sp. MBLB1832]WNR45453.1 hypothetical protein MJB10_04780 [Paenibacillus sp. MBLB1832]